MNLINIILISFILQFVSQTPVLRTYSIVMNLIWSSRREVHLKSTHCGNKGFGGNGWSLSSNKSASGSWFVCLEGERELPVVLPSMILNSRAMFTARCLCSVKKVSWEPPSMARLTKNLHSAGFSPPHHCLPLSSFPPFSFACCLLLCSPCLCYFTFYKKNLSQIPKYLKLFLIDAEYGFCPFPWCPIVPFLGSACLPVCAALLTFSHWRVLAMPSGIYIIQPCGLHPMGFSHTVSW